MTIAKYDPVTAKLKRDADRQKLMQSYATFTGAKLANGQTAEINQAELLASTVKKTLDNIRQSLMSGVSNVYCVAEPAVIAELKTVLSDVELQKVKFNVGQ